MMVGAVCSFFVVGKISQSLLSCFSVTFIACVIVWLLACVHVFLLKRFTRSALSTEVVFTGITIFTGELENVSCSER